MHLFCLSDNLFSLNNLIFLELHFFFLQLWLIFFFEYCFPFCVFSSLDYFFHSAALCFSPFLYCQFLNSTLSRLELYFMPFLALQFLAYNFEIRGFLSGKVDAEKIPKQHDFVTCLSLGLRVHFSLPFLGSLIHLKSPVEFLCNAQNRVRENILKEVDKLHFSSYALLICC